MAKKYRKILYISILILVVIGVFLAAHTLTDRASTDEIDQLETSVTPEETETIPSNFSVYFFCQYKLLEKQTVEDGEVPKPLSCSVPGLVFYGWVDRDGNPIDPLTVPVHDVLRYDARLFPDLNSNNVFLFPYEDGWLYPRAYLTLTQFSAAVRALATEDAVSFLPDLPEGEEAVSFRFMSEWLCDLFPSEAVLNATESFVPDDLVKRGEFASVINCLLDRACDCVVVEDGFVLPPDLYPEHIYYTELLEATIPHTKSDDGSSWDEIIFEPLMPEGLHLKEGSLYYIRENGTILTDSEQDGLTFDIDGFYTSGNVTLDSYVRAILRDLQEETVDADRFSLLRAAFDYSRDSFTYLRKAPFVMGATGWEIDCAIEMLEKKLGNCYNYAAVFWSLARGLGYDAKIFSGTITDTYQPHGWVEIEIDGANYVFDPEMEMAYHRRGVFNKEMFMLPEQKAKGWTYRKAA